jgi:response regulator RpfG family c-di-GMP phosphodiesterase
VLQEEEKEEVKVKVLVVEDNMINRKIMVKILSTKLVSLGILRAYRGQMSLSVADRNY